MKPYTNLKLYTKQLMENNIHSGFDDSNLSWSNLNFAVSLGCSPEIAPGDAGVSDTEAAKEAPEIAPGVSDTEAAKAATGKLVAESIRWIPISRGRFSNRVLRSRSGWLCCKTKTGNVSGFRSAHGFGFPGFAMATTPRQRIRTLESSFYTNTISLS